MACSTKIVIIVIYGITLPRALLAGSVPIIKKDLADHTN